MIYKKKVSTRDEYFKDRVLVIMSGSEFEIIKLDDSEVICDGCNKNMYSEKEETFCWLVYLSKNDLDSDSPCGAFCDDCVKLIFPYAKEVKK